MKKIMIFGGTTEGREIASFLKGKNVDFVLSVATEYSKDIIDKDTPISVKRMDRQQMAAYFQNESTALVIDATHPYAEEVSENIKSACMDTGVELIRIIRERKEIQGVFFESHRQCAEYLNTKDGNIFLTIGSKELKHYRAVSNYKDRVFLRILPMVSSLENALELGFKNANIFCLQGTFTTEMNVEFLKMTGSKFLVSKDSGITGGMEEKVKAAKLSEAELLIIGAPQEEGVTLKDAFDFLNNYIEGAVNEELK